MGWEKFGEIEKQRNFIVHVIVINHNSACSFARIAVVATEQHSGRVRLVALSWQTIDS